uniref:Uncharacterized protein n=1 Tax=Cacopsylla melanoneura TaxID=428564 RepID=A0A8D8V316_9HEMI
MNSLLWSFSKSIICVLLAFGKDSVVPKLVLFPQFVLGTFSVSDSSSRSSNTLSIVLFVSVSILLLFLFLSFINTNSNTVLLYHLAFCLIETLWIGWVKDNIIS